MTTARFTAGRPPPSDPVRAAGAFDVAFPKPLSGDAPPDRTSARSLERFIAGRTLVSAEGPEWVDMFVQVYSRNIIQQPFLVPAVAEPLIVWVMAGKPSSRNGSCKGNGGRRTSASATSFSPTPQRLTNCAGR